ncbi:DUF2474 domain-containing protein [Aurantiacibacter rhizosphaerae]|uniref:DUF2474 family protein n=1 Tax=Aurantiacibacter rhizosphaerae TaxID=2691582 RepID=A0A844X9Z4_9SPHN|nr:DUF2474 domain-containing protein [Aurantiacibacter rhizosphaerae]MWV27177.1 DUF2474 family protein [Aurantiacibacter rhizosphaerae]
MADTPNTPDTAGPLWKRLLWMAAIWLASVAVLGTVAMVIRWWLNP